MNNSKNSLPNGWSLKKLGEIFAITSGTTPSRIINEYFKNGTHLWVKTTDLNNNVISDTEEKVTDLAMKKTSLKKLPVGTVLVAMYGGYNQIGRTGLLQKEASINQALSAILPNKDVAEPYFLLSWLNCKVEDWKNFAASSRKDPNITKSDVLGFPMLLPPLPEQQKIATILGTWDAAIQTTTALLSALQKRKKGLMQQLLSPKSDWKEVRLGECFDFIKTESFSRENLTYSSELGSYFYIHYGDIHAKFNKSILDLNSERRIPRLKNECSQKAFQFLKSGDLVFADASEDLVGIGDCVELKNVEAKKVIGGLHTIAIRPKTTFAPEFLGYLFMSKLIKRQMQSTATGISVYGLSKTNLANFHFSFPSFIEQARIAAILNAADTELRQTEVYLEKLKTQKRGLMQQLLTGKVRVITT